MTREDNAVSRRESQRRVSSYVLAAKLLGLSKSDPLSLDAAVRSGLRFGALERFAVRTRLSLSEVGQAIKVKPRTLARRKIEGRLQPEESDRLLRTSRIVARALELFEGDIDATRRWLDAPQKSLGGSTPLEFATTDVGAREVDDLIGRLEHGVAA